MKKIVSLFLAMLLAVTAPCAFSSCENDADISEAVYVDTSSRQPCVYDDYVFYFDTDTQEVNYQIVTNVQQTGISIITDPLSEGEDNPLNQMLVYYFLVDIISSDKNGHSPVLLLGCMDYSDPYAESDYKVISYDLATNSLTVLASGLYSPFQSFAVYGEYVIFTTQDGDEGYNVHCVKTDGTEYVTLDNSECSLYRVRYAYEDKIYFTDAAYRLYSAPLDLSEKEYLCDLPASYVSPFIKDDYLIFCGEAENIPLELEDSEMEYTLISADLCRLPLSDLSGDAETLISGVNVGRCYRDKFYYYIAENREGTYYLNTDTLHVYSFDTMTSEVVWEKDGVGYYAAFSDKYIIYEDTYPGTACYIAYNINTGEETEIPY
ncbi:MAG: DUF5050 domain-containing protein [Clostridia bacterium]|nr:DUF5050 domain-containing protein [Clostridia bacterium]